MLCISFDTGTSTDKILEYSKVKDDKITDPDMYLGATHSKMMLEGGDM